MDEPRLCECGCGSRLDTLRTTRRYVDATHRKRGHRARRHEAPVERQTEVEQRGLVDGPLTTAVLTELTAADKQDSAVGQTCLALAQRIDHGTEEGGSALAALSRELRAAMTAALGSEEKPRVSRLALIRSGQAAG